MSALGQKQTCALQNVMSALPPKADMCSALANVCFVPKATSAFGALTPFDSVYINRLRETFEVGRANFDELKTISEPVLNNA